MTTHTLHTTQFIARPIDEVFDFFSRAENLARITPSGMGFELLTADTRMRAGLTIDYRIRPLLGIPTRWRTEITSYEPPTRFTDLQAPAHIAAGNTPTRSCPSMGARSSRMRSSTKCLSVCSARSLTG